jgi:hypothetical protein
MMNGGIKVMVSEAALIELHRATCSEITRYRDREWQCQGLFTTAIVIIIGFILNHISTNTIIQNYRWLYLAGAIGLTIGNIYYTCYTHTRLTQQRNILLRTHKLLEYFSTEVDGKTLLPDEWDRPLFCFYHGWLRGFCSHLAPFFLVDVALVWIIFWLLYFPGN